MLSEWLPRETKMGFDSDQGRSGGVGFSSVWFWDGRTEKSWEREELESTGGTLIFSRKKKSGICLVASGSWKGWKGQRDGLLWWEKQLHSNTKAVECLSFSAQGCMRQDQRVVPATGQWGQIIS